MALFHPKLMKRTNLLEMNPNVLSQPLAPLRLRLAEPRMLLTVLMTLVRYSIPVPSTRPQGYPYEI